MNNQLTGKYSIPCSCNQDTSCQFCGGSRSVPTGNITLKEMATDVVYSVKAPYADFFNFDEVLLQRVKEDTLRVTLRNSDDAQETSVIFPLDLLTQLRKNADRLLTMEIECDSLIEFLVDNPNPEDFDLDILAEIIGVGVEQAVNSGCLRLLDSKWGMSLSGNVAAFPAVSFGIEHEYQKLCRHAAELMKEEGVTLHWALRNYETKSCYTVLDILTDAVKPMDQLAADVYCLLRQMSGNQEVEEFEPLQGSNLSKQTVVGSPFEGGQPL